MRERQEDVQAVFTNVCGWGVFGRHIDSIYGRMRLNTLQLFDKHVAWLLFMLKEIHEKRLLGGSFSSVKYFGSYCFILTNRM